MSVVEEAVGSVTGTDGCEGCAWEICVGGADTAEVVDAEGTEGTDKANVNGVVVEEDMVTLK